MRDRGHGLRRGPMRNFLGLLRALRARAAATERAGRGGWAGAGAIRVAFACLLALALVGPRYSVAAGQGIAGRHLAASDRAVPPSGWTAWAPLGGVLTESPAAAAFDNRLYAIVRGTGDRLYVTSSADGASWDGWLDLGGVLAASPGAAVFGGRLYVFAAGVDPVKPNVHPLFVISSADGTTWTPWASLGGDLTSAPAAAANNGALSVFARGAGDALYAKTTRDGAAWSGWQVLGGVLTSAPAVAAFAGALNVFAAGIDPQDPPLRPLYILYYFDVGVWAPWALLGGDLTSAPAASVATELGSEQRYIFARGRDGALYERHDVIPFGVSDWENLGGELNGAPAAATLDGVVYAFAWGGGNQLYERHLDLAP